MMSLDVQVVRDGRLLGKQTIKTVGRKIIESSDIDGGDIIKIMGGLFMVYIPDSSPDSLCVVPVELIFKNKVPHIDEIVSLAGALKEPVPSNIFGILKTMASL
jgi:hypothetical protein